MRRSLSLDWYPARKETIAGLTLPVPHKKSTDPKYSYKQIFRMLSKYKKVRIDKDAPWEDVTKLKYIEELTKTLGV